MRENFSNIMNRVNVIIICTVVGGNVKKTVVTLIKFDFSVCLKIFSMQEI